MADVSGDGDFKLVLTDIKLEADKRSRLKVYKGTFLTSDQVLPDVPSSVISFYTDELEPRVPAIGVACGSDLLIYKNTKPFYKFSVPSTPIAPLEEDVWKRIDEGVVSHDKALNELKSINYNLLSPRSQSLLSLPHSQIDEYVAKFKGITPMKSSVIVSMSTVNKNNQEIGSVSCPVLSTENGVVYILDPQTFTILHQVSYRK